MGDNGLIPQSIVAGTRDLASKAKLEILGDWEAIDYQSYCLRLTLELTAPPTDFIPQRSSWYLVVSKEYPRGSIRLYPAQEGGLVHTFPHQSANLENWNEKQPWRTGNLCLETAVHVLGRDGFDQEPFDQERRISWHIERAQLWLELAARGELQQDGEPFELPPLPLKVSEGKDERVAFSETEDSFSTWGKTESRVGFVTFSKIPGTGTYCSMVFHDHSKEILVKHDWGMHINQDTNEGHQGFWVKTEAFPFEMPWVWPLTWSALSEKLADEQIGFEIFFHTVRERLGDGKPHLFLFGFPVPENYGEEPARIHWQAIWTPPLQNPERKRNGFRNNKRKRQFEYKFSFINKSIAWVGTRNWSRDQVSIRGVIDTAKASLKVALIGVGALGSHLAELLVRSGFHDLVIIDFDNLEVGNLTRHTLDITDVGQSKALRIVEKLNRFTPHARVKGIPFHFPPTEKASLELVDSCDVIIDCTANDDVLFALRSYAWKTEKLFFSFSLGFKGRRIYAYGSKSSFFPVLDFLEKFAPWGEKEISEINTEGLPWEGYGCWHPVFPVNVDDVNLAANAAYKFILKNLPDKCEREFCVFEHALDHSGCSVLKMAEEPGTT